MGISTHLINELTKLVPKYIGAADVDPPLTARQVLEVLKRAEAAHSAEEGEKLREAKEARDRYYDELSKDTEPGS